MKKTIVWVLTVLILVFLCGCNDSPDNTDSDTYETNYTSDIDSKTDYTDEITDSYETIVSNDSNNTQSSVTGSQAPNANNNQNNSTSQPSAKTSKPATTTTKPEATSTFDSSEWRSTTKHFHSYSESIIQEAGIGIEGIVKCTCICGDTFTLPIPAQSSLDIPALSKSVSFYSYSTVNVTNITYKFNGSGLVLYFSGTKTYDYKGAEHSDSCYIGWKLYGPDSSVVKSGKFSSPSVAVGESFTNKEETAIYTYDNFPAGAYRLEILDVN